MATKKKEKEPRKIEIIIPKLEINNIVLHVIGLSPLIAENGKGMIDTAPGSVRNNGPKEPTKYLSPEEEYENSRYKIDKKSDGFPAYLFKRAIVNTAHTIVPEMQKNHARSIIYVKPEYDTLIRIYSDQFPPEMRRGIERIKGKPCVHYRAIYRNWHGPMTVSFPPNLISAQQLVNLFVHGGWWMGVGGHRPEKGGEFGKFIVVPEEEFQAQKGDLDKIKKLLGVE